jgi:hypothetical protein
MVLPASRAQAIGEADLSHGRHPRRSETGIWDLDESAKSGTRSCYQTRGFGDTTRNASEHALGPYAPQRRQVPEFPQFRSGEVDGSEGAAEAGQVHGGLHQRN